jgi:thiol-disulfide isomerase/thioredoxin
MAFNPMSDVLQHLRRGILLREGLGRPATAMTMLAKRIARHGLGVSGGALAAVVSQQAASACLPPSIASSTIQAATLVAAGQAVATGPVFIHVVALTEGVLKTMLLAKFKIVTAVLFVIGIISTSVSGILFGAMVTQESNQKQVASLGNPAPGADDTAAQKTKHLPSRAEQLKAIQTDYQKELAEVGAAIRAGKVLATKDGTYTALAELGERFAKRTRKLIDANPKDEVALDAILFSIQQLVADEDDPGLQNLILAHHSASAKIRPILDRRYTTDDFLRAIAEKSPHAEIRARARLVQAKRLVHASRAQEAEAICESILNTKELTALHRDADDLLFEIRHLSLGKLAPEVEGYDLDNKPMKLSEYRGKVVLLVFWGTWCGPCMAMVPHERELAKGNASRPFQIVGVYLDDEAKAKEAVRKEQITWRSFKDYSPKDKRQISNRWNVHGWPTLFLIDHQGVIRHKFIGKPEEKELDAAVEEVITAAESALKKPDKK